ncbi:DUF5694 domain-containing protein [Emticicia sp. 17c]|uniref:DUF5694 domain-containing protein n=1 Tax=Emticicia sp. 17c TaxID=3127704 RepID=UPI00301C5AD2
MKRISFFIFLIAFPISTLAQSNRVQIVFLGVFHMGESTDYKQGAITDLLSAERQQQIADVVETLAKYNPDKIFVENTPDAQPYWNNVYKNYLNGFKPADYSAEHNEIYQLGIKLAARVNIPSGVTCINYVQPDLMKGLKTARNKVDTLLSFYTNELEKKRPSYEAYFKANPSVNKSFKDYLARYETWKNLSIKDHLVLLNSEESIRALHYFNITGWMDTNTNGYGAEFTAKEYFRNTKILQNILLSVSPSDRRLLVIIGGGHVQVLRDMLKSHPYFEVVDATTLLK